jgi:hypothetical protein
MVRSMFVQTISYDMYTTETLLIVNLTLFTYLLCGSCLFGGLFGWSLGHVGNDVAVAKCEVLDGSIMRQNLSSPAVKTSCRQTTISTYQAQVVQIYLSYAVKSGSNFQSNVV